MPAPPATLISPEEARARIAEAHTRLLVVGEHEPPAERLPGAPFVEARAFRDGLSRGVLRPPALAHLCARAGVAQGTRVLLADAAGGPHAALACWTLALYGHAPLALVDGRPPAQEGNGNGESGATYRPGPPQFESFRASRGAVREVLGAGHALLDVRTPAEFAGTLTAPADAPQEGILRGGHLPGALNVPYDHALQPDGRLRSRGELLELYQEEHGLDPSAPVVVYGRAAARACHTWFVLACLLGFERVRVYDGGWAEWGNLVAAPVARGTDGASR